MPKTRNNQFLTANDTPRHLAFVLTNPAHPKVSDEERGFAERLAAEFPAFGEAGTLARAFCRLVRERDDGMQAAWTVGSPK